MKSRRIFAAFFLCLCIAIASVLSVSAAQAGANVSMEVSNTETAVGETIVVTINNYAINIAGFGCYLEFDKDALECVSITGADGDAEMGLHKIAGKTTWVAAKVADSVANTNSDGRFSFGCVSENNTEYAAGIVAQLTFKVLRSGNITLNLYEDSAIVSGTTYYGFVESEELEADIGSIKHKSQSVSLDSEIKINKYVIIKGFNGIDINKKGGLLVWYSPVTEAEAVYGTEDFKNPGLITANSAEGRYGQYTEGIAAKEYADELYLRVYIEIADGEYMYGDLREYSVQDYCETALARSNDQKLKDLCISMLYYGTAAQMQFNYNTSDLAYESIKNLYSNIPWNASMITALTSANTALVGSGDLKKETKSISLDGILYSNFYFNPAVNASWTITSGKIQVWSHVTDALTENNVSYTVNLQSASKGWGAQCEGVVAKELGNTFYVRAVLNGSDGKVHYSDVIPYSAETYAQAVLNNIPSGTLPDLVKAMVIYGDCARLYFAK